MGLGRVGMEKLKNSHKGGVVRIWHNTRITEVMCDSSDYAIGVVLGQREDGKPYVIYYVSKSLNDAQRNYTTIMVYALDKFRAYLIGSSIVVFTDHSALKYLLTKMPRLG